jgi:hypothetical protein
MSLGAWAAKHGLELPGYVRQATDEEEIQARQDQHARCAAGPLLGGGVALAAAPASPRRQCEAAPGPAAKRARSGGELHILLPSQLQSHQQGLRSPRSPLVGPGAMAPTPSPASQASVNSLGAEVPHPAHAAQAPAGGVQLPASVALPDGFAQLDSGVLVRLQSLFRVVFSLGGCQEVGVQVVACLPRVCA